MKKYLHSTSMLPIIILSACSSPSLDECDPSVGGAIQFVRCYPSGFGARQQQLELTFGATQRKNIALLNEKRDREDAIEQKKREISIMESQISIIYNDISLLESKLSDVNLNSQNNMSLRKQVADNINDIAIRLTEIERQARGLYSSGYVRSHSIVGIADNAKTVSGILFDLAKDLLIPEWWEFVPGGALWKKVKKAAKFISDAYAIINAGFEVYDLYNRPTS